MLQRKILKASTRVPVVGLFRHRQGRSSDMLVNEKLNVSLWLQIVDEPWGKAGWLAGLHFRCV
jgi:hypothetical protein